MGLTTPVYALPYPVGTDRVMDGDNAIQALAERMEAVLATIPGRTAYVQKVVDTPGIGAVWADIPGLSLTVNTVLGRRYRVSAGAISTFAAGSGPFTVHFALREGGVTMQDSPISHPNVGYLYHHHPSIMIGPSTGVHTYIVSAYVNAGGATIQGGADHPAWLSVEDLGTGILTARTRPALPGGETDVDNTLPDEPPDRMDNTLPETAEPRG